MRPLFLSPLLIPAHKHEKRTEPVPVVAFVYILYSAGICCAAFWLLFHGALHALAPGL